MAQPRALVPERMPTLELDLVQVRRALAADAQWVGPPAPLDPLAADLEGLFLRDMVVQGEVAEDERSFFARRGALARQLQELIAERGPQAAHLLRGRALVRMQRAMAGELPERDVLPAMGAFANQLQAHGALVDGEIVAPDFVVRSFFKARWNTIYDLPMDWELQEVEKRAVHGWLGLNSKNLSINARLAALKRFAELGGRRASEAQGVLLTAVEDHDLAVEALTRAQEAAGGLRVANYLLGARVAAGLSGDG